MGDVHEKNATTGEWGVRSSTQTTDSSGAPAGNVTVSDGTTGGKEQVTPTVGGVSTPSITPVASTYTANVKLLVVVGTQDDVEAGAALSNEYPNVFSVLPNEVVSRRSPASAITRVSVIMLITGVASGAITKLVDSAESLVATNLRTFEFDAADDVRDINIGVIDNTPFTGGDLADTNVFVEGFTNG